MKGKNIIILTVALTALALAALIPGCRGGTNTPAANNKTDREIKTGLIDSDRLLMDYPEFKKFLDKKQTESRQIRNIMMKKPGEQGGRLSGEDEAHIKKVTEDFMKKEAVIIKKFVDEVRDASKQVQDEKKLDMVINNPFSRSVVEFGGVDITDDVKAKMTELRKQKSSTDEAKKEKEK